MLQTEHPARAAGEVEIQTESPGEVESQTELPGGPGPGALLVAGELANFCKTDCALLVLVQSIVFQIQPLDLHA